MNFLKWMKSLNEDLVKDVIDLQNKIKGIKARLKTAPNDQKETLEAELAALKERKSKLLELDQ